MPRSSAPDEKNAEAGPGRLIGKVAAGVAGVVVVAVVGTLLIIALGNVTGSWRTVVAVVMGLVIAWLGLGYFRYLTHPPPPDLEPLPVPQLQLSYLCEMCGLELAVVAVAKERAPKHCGESMVLVRREEG